MAFAFIVVMQNVITKQHLTLWNALIVEAMYIHTDIFEKGYHVSDTSCIEHQTFHLSNLYYTTVYEYCIIDRLV